MSYLKQKRCIDDIWPMANKRVLVRCDLNVKVRSGIIAKDDRLRAITPTIRKIVDNGGMAILLSHMGRPTGHKYSALKDSPENRQRYLKIWKNESGVGYTTFFSILSGEDKKKILRWSSVSQKAEALNESEDAGKADLFSSLPNEEKRGLLQRFTSDESYCKSMSTFPQLRQYSGFEDELTLRPVAARLSNILGIDVKFAEDCMNADDAVAKLEPGQVLLLENLRFYSDENSRNESERLVMARKIASYGDFFCSDGELISYFPTQSYTTQILSFSSINILLVFISSIWHVP